MSLNESTEIKIVELIRLSSLSRSSFSALKTEGKEESVWITLGHFDAMVISTIHDTKHNETVFKTIGEHNLKLADRNDGTSYYHPIYLLRTNDCAEKGWDEDWFVSVMRVHLSLESTSTEKELIKREIKSLSSIITQGEIAHYSTLELSDMVVVAHGNCLAELLKFAMALRRIKAIKKVYTYIGVNYKLLGSEKAIYTGNDVLGHLSMRFSVQLVEKVDDQLRVIMNDLGETIPYSVTGVDDIILCYTNINTSKLITLFRTLFVRSLSPQLSAFFDVTTRLGCEGNCMKIEESVANKSNEKHLLQHGNGGLDAREKGTKNLSDVCQELHKLSLILKKNIECGEASVDEIARDSWLKPLNELTNALVHMSRTPVLDEFCFLMLDGVAAFLLQINLQQHNERSYENPQVWPSLYEFVDCWANMMEHVLRLEGQLTHYPETRPMLYDIPVPVLEYTLAFLQRCANKLIEKDREKLVVPIHFLLVPRLYTRIEAQELFPVQDNVPALVTVTLPLHTLYDPQYLMCALCHEVSHFVGERPRCREPRIEFYICGVVGVAAKLLFESYDEMIAKQLKDELCKNVHGTRMADLKRNTVKAVYEIVGEKRTFSAFMHRVFLRAAAAKKRTALINIPGSKNWDLFKKACMKLGDMFRETYADLCMIHLSGISPNQYLAIFTPELSDVLKVNMDSQYVYRYFAIRCFVVLRAAWPEWTIDKANVDNGIGHVELIDALKDLYISNSKTDEIKGVFPLTTIRPLISYLEMCKGELKTINCTEVSKMVERFTDNADHCDNELFSEVLIEHREATVNRIHELLDPVLEDNATNI